MRMSCVDAECRFNLHMRVELPRCESADPLSVRRIYSLDLRPRVVLAAAGQIESVSDVLWAKNSQRWRALPVIYEEQISLAVFAF